MIHSLLNLLPFEVRKKRNGHSLPDDLKADKVFFQLYTQVSSRTMTSPERLYALYEAINFTAQKRLAGAFVECGVWRGGSAMMIALVL
ncbi:MAG: TylF/MycF family methyltransferase, partial [Chitinophagaceae bacterium]|nr:TylF/MycF family methyltransferase [Chitinophagaceae bacterium]